ncbi:helix-turn-helix transcriptional regulator [Nocardia sp. NPDC051750]|uniref:helix-turn-helix transcriptional regulator n=1 Tax=Nocardia sp. NPDC051750 TaxID=3364325 RepID=UPI00378ABCCA
MDGTSEVAWLGRSDRRGTDRHVGLLVREYRLARGLKQAAVARDLGITQQFLSQVETGVRNVTLDQRHGFMRVLGIPAEELGLAGRRRGGHAPQETTAAVAASRGRWRVQRQWLNQHRAEPGNTPLLKASRSRHQRSTGC